MSEKPINKEALNRVASRVKAHGDNTGAPVTIDRAREIVLQNLYKAKVEKNRR
jgi:hypothetical protein